MSEPVSADASINGPADGLLRAPSPEDVGISSAAVLRFLDALDEHKVEMNSFMLLRHGKVAAEGWWWPYRPDRVHMLHSVTKALTSTAVGLAVAEQRFRLHDPVVSFFPERLSGSLSPNLAAMTVEHLLTQTSGHADSVSGSVWRGISTSWIDEFFKIPVPHAPGTHFKYSSATSFMLSAIVTRTTGLSLHGYLKPRFFEPLGIDRLQWDIGPEAINPGGNGASATTSDFLKVVGVYANQGKWNGRQLIPAEWVRKAGCSAYGNPYGYHWWVSPDGSGFLAFGAFGQYGIVFPDLDLAIVTTAAVPSSISRLDELLPPLIWKHVPEMCKPAPYDPRAAALLRERTAALRLLDPIAPAQSPPPATLSGRRFLADENADGVRAIALEFSSDRCVFTLESDRGVHAIDVGLGRWIEGVTSMPGAGLHHGYEPSSLRVVAGGRWSDGHTLEMWWQFVETAFRDTVRLCFDGDSVTFDRSVNVNGGTTVRPRIALRHA